MNDNDRNPANCRPEGELDITALSAQICGTYDDNCGINNIEGGNLPRRKEIVRIIEQLLEIVFPGYDCAVYTRAEIPKVIEKLLANCRRELFDQIGRALRFRCDRECDSCEVKRQSERATDKLLSSLPAVREAMKLDVAAAYAGDPAAKSYDEIILSYPGIRAITIQRIAHILYCECIPLLPRMMTEYAHSETGIDIHPGVTLGKGVFIDHGTGVIIGETAIVGDNVRIYQGVTLGAMSFPKDACGMLIKGKKRHPTIGNNVTIYAGAAVLGDITIGDDSIVGGNVWVTESLERGTKITARAPEHVVSVRRNAPKQGA